MNAAAWSAIVLGAALLAVAALGLLRLPDALARQHAATKAATLALGLMTCGLLLLHHGPEWWVRGALLLLILALTVPVASHALGSAAARQDAAGRAEKKGA